MLGRYYNFTQTTFDVDRTYVYEKYLLNNVKHVAASAERRNELFQNSTSFSNSL